MGQQSDSNSQSGRSPALTWPPFLVISLSCLVLVCIIAAILPFQREGYSIENYGQFMSTLMNDFSKPGRNSSVHTEDYDPRSTYLHCPVLLSGSPFCDKTPRDLPDWCLPAMSTVDGARIMDMARTMNKFGSVSKRSGAQFADRLQAEEVSVFQKLSYFTICRENTEVCRRIGKKATLGIPDLDLPRQKHLNFTKCAVVGSSDKLLSAQHGALIDEHSLVIRLNEAPTVGFEPYVGSKTNIRIQNSIRQGFAEGPDEWCLVGGYKNQPLGNCSQVISRSPQFSEYCRYVWEAIPTPSNLSIPLSSNGRPKTKMSGGFLSVTLALHLCRHVSIFGLSQDPAQPDHYFNKTFHKAPMTASTWSKIHPWELERECLNILSETLPSQIQIF